MGKMLKLKYTDALVQLMAIAIPWLWFSFTEDSERILHLDHVLISYFATGTVQLGSAILNRIYLPAELRSKSRAWYEFALILAIGITVIGYFTNALIIALIILLWISPLLAIWYFVLSIAEIRKTSRHAILPDDNHEDTHPE